MTLAELNEMAATVKEMYARATNEVGHSWAWDREMDMMDEGERSGFVYDVFTLTWSPR